MRIAVDLHIHSALSPCADDDMTPNNIVNMSLLKGLDAIAVTDHNASNNVEAVTKVAGKRLVVLPGMEVQSREDVHLLCYFADVRGLKDFDDMVIKRYLKKIANDPAIFGRQLIMDDKDRIIGEREELLLSCVDLSVEEIVKKTTAFGGAVVPAHVDRPSYSILSNLGFIPEDLHFHVLEFSQNDAHLSFDNRDFFCIFSSDAHHLGDILERKMLLDVEEVSAEALLAALKFPVL